MKEYSKRDIDDIRSFMESEVGRTGIINNVIYDRAKKAISSGTESDGID